tara:strand:- start:3444 stop:3698 length:255 start_codon:yes stop_codon:yes gene_type:complete
MRNVAILIAFIFAVKMFVFTRTPRSDMTGVKKPLAMPMRRDGVSVDMRFKHPVHVNLGQKPGANFRDQRYAASRIAVYKKNAAP